MKRYWGTLNVQVRFDAENEEEASGRLHQILQELEHPDIFDGTFSQLGMLVYDEEFDCWEKVSS